MRSKGQTPPPFKKSVTSFAALANSFSLQQSNASHKMMALVPNISVKRTQTRYAGCAAYLKR